MAKYVCFFGFFITALLFSCDSSKTKVSTHFVDRTLESLLEKKGEKISKYQYESADLLGHSVALFFVVNDDSIPKSEIDRLSDYFEDKIIRSSIFDVISTGDQIDKKLKANRLLEQQTEIYLESLTTVAVSDRDISNPLGKYLQAMNILTLQIDRWPCSDCSTKTLRMKLRLVDSPSGDIVWTGIAEKNMLEEEFENLSIVADTIFDELIRQFYHQFKLKWHRKRFRNLASLAK